MFKKFLIFSFVLIFSSSLLLLKSVKSHDDISENLLRLHIIANSNSDIDQRVKLLIRDEISKFSKTRNIDNSTKSAFINDFKKDLSLYEDVANSILKKENLPYKATLSLDRLYIPRKIYNGIVLPKGRYDALVVRLGESSGENWWCVLYPPLCFTQSTSGELDESGEEYLKNTLSPESYDLITNKNLTVKYEFYLLELFNSLKEKISPTKS